MSEYPNIALGHKKESLVLYVYKSSIHSNRQSNQNDCPSNHQYTTVVTSTKHGEVNNMIIHEVALYFDLIVGIICSFTIDT